MKLQWNVQTDEMSTSSTQTLGGSGSGEQEQEQEQELKDRHLTKQIRSSIR